MSSQSIRGTQNPFKQSVQYEVQVDVNYNAKYRKVITEGSGPQTRFIYLGRNKENDAWKIISIGTGP
ncbi:DUF4829 domain-containing protein [Alicyclobacillus sp. SO9]|uniref:DUF4829 domain-containing protein n=1 Tax=Alicyclobacillus sp. SO9 TaxID=2665646 RepID=UPI0018E833F8|nr:DUF4829 domain-containing protein [Alicyclobacillus sp. SO9]